MGRWPIFLAAVAVIALACSPVFAALPGCSGEVAVIYKIPLSLLRAIHEIEGGKTGLAVKNKDGSLDRGLMQINTFWDKPLSKYGITDEQVRSDDCMNVAVGAWILQKEAIRFGNWPDAIAAYNAGAGNLSAGRAYSVKVMKAWARIRNSGATEPRLLVWRQPIIVR